MGRTSSIEAGLGLSERDRQTLLEVAREAIRYELERGRPMPVDPEAYSDALREHRATFVTLRRLGDLVGCIGTLQPREALVASVAHNARAAAFEDPRTSGVRPGGLESVDIHISILGKPERLQFASERDLLEQLRPGVDGLILEERFYRATFLPSVWETLPEPQDFLEHLKRKAGLPGDYWSSTLVAYRYTAESIGEE